MAAEIYAVVRRDTAAWKLNDLADGPADATDPHLTHGVRRIASYELDQDDARSATVSFYQAPSAPPAATLATATGCAEEVIAVREDCVALLLVDGVRELATRSTDQIDEPPIEAPGPGSKLSAGIVLVDEQSRLTIREPAGPTRAMSTHIRRVASTLARRPNRRPTASCSKRPGCAL
jgi:hypothetical protein